ncbi:hypothetical protein LEP1GSC188_4902 [Leptospira weilii serovar Topaz str. LT2116]|uniref:Uncharacterized protein n=1 Tax=Leptospira weilii serovar Topaz str. LT2116 TaxID=1088540 RepID=M3FM71_9LEPT|nr:hypothetical protein LEP1GSC188_4902 [Leptospira weilii serovar Topaz str. LT2116]
MTEFTYDELRELSYLVWKTKTKFRVEIDSWERLKMFGADISEILLDQTKREFELFEALEFKLEKMKHSVPI